MHLLTNNEMAFATEYIKTIEQIVVTSACSCIPPMYMEGLKKINAERHYTQCVTCNSSIFLATNLLYKDYIYSKEQLNKLAEIDKQLKTEVSNENLQVKTKTTRARKNKQE